MNPLDEFEKRLARAPLKGAPKEWRTPILESARRNALAAKPNRWERIPIWLRELMWPHPVAWGTVAACWVIAAVFNIAASWPSPATDTLVQTAPPPAESARMAREQQALVTLLLQESGEEPGETSPPPKPRSDIDRPPFGYRYRQGGIRFGGREQGSITGLAAMERMPGEGAGRTSRSPAEGKNGFDEVRRFLEPAGSQIG
jgi:hypothetical protein